MGEIVDFYKKAKYKISHSDDLYRYAHVIDEEADKYISDLDRIGNQNIYFATTKRQLMNLSNTSSFIPMKELCPKVWINGKINSKVRLRLLDIADDFIDTLDIPWVHPNDIILTGSMANYNWSKYSDFDLHIVYNFSKVDKRVDFVKSYFDSKKNEWNNNHRNIKIYGFPVEVYVQDSSEEHIATGVYSIEKNEWLVKPDRNNFRSTKANMPLIKGKALEAIERIALLKREFDVATDEDEIEKIGRKAKDILTKIKGIRKAGLEMNGELSSGNIFFKLLRRTGYIGYLVDIKKQAYDRLVSLK